MLIKLTYYFAKVKFPFWETVWEQALRWRYSLVRLTHKNNDRDETNENLGYNKIIESIYQGFQLQLYYATDFFFGTL